MKVKPQTVDEYISGFPDNSQKILEELRATIKNALPGAEEVISYAIPTFQLNGKSLIHYAGYKNHVGVYPAPEGDEVFNKAIAPYKSGKSTIQFRLDKSLPLDLITKIAVLRLTASSGKAPTKKKLA